MEREGCARRRGSGKKRGGGGAIYNKEAEKVTARRGRKERMTLIFRNKTNRTSGGGFFK